MRLNEKASRGRKYTRIVFIVFVLISSDIIKINKMVPVIEGARALPCR